MTHQLAPTHRKCGNTSEGVKITLPTMLLGRLDERVQAVGTTRSRYIATLIEMDLARHEAVAMGQGRR